MFIKLTRQLGQVISHLNDVYTLSENESVYIEPKEFLDELIHLEPAIREKFGD